MICTEAFLRGDDSSLLLNERLALCFGMTLLRALICEEITHVQREDMRERRQTVFDGEISFPKTNHGDYKHNLLVQLFHTRKEAKYNILALAETLYLPECFNLVKNHIPEDIFKKV